MIRPKRIKLMFTNEVLLPAQSEPTPAMPSASTLVTPSGVRIDYETWGEGPPLVLVHGCFSDHRTNWMYVKPLLEPHVTGYAISRRGRGATDATPGQSIEDEMEDAAALIREIGTPVFLLGHSYGAHVALGAAARVPDLVRKLVLYEPPWPHVVDDQLMPRLEAMADAGDWDGFAATFLSEVYEIPGEVLDGLRGTEDWAAVLEDGPATLHDLRALARFAFDPERYMALPVPVLLQVGTETPPVSVTDALASVLPNVSIGELAGQAHEGMTTAPEQYAEAVRRFLMV
jgi:pimeloyl-ACP methyl ester carboxylesterase